MNINVINTRMNREFVSHIALLYDYYEIFKHSRKSRIRKTYLRKMFNLWYKCPDAFGTGNNEYWTFKADDRLYYRQLFWKNSKLLYISQIDVFLRELFTRSCKTDTVKTD